VVILGKEEQMIDDRFVTYMTLIAGGLTNKSLVSASGE